MLLMKPPLQSNNACGVDVFVVVALLWTVRLTLTTPFRIILLTIDSVIIIYYMINHSLLSPVFGARRAGRYNLVTFICQESDGHGRERAITTRALQIKPPDQFQ
jgi:hypothetical protein